MNWQPIETAPKDELILVARTKRMCGPCAAMNSSQDGWVTETPGEWVSIYTPEHWMPMPAAPGDSAAHFPAQQEPLCWVFEDELPKSMPRDAYSALYPHSRVDTVRMFPIFGPAGPTADAETIRKAARYDWMMSGRVVKGDRSGPDSPRVQHVLYAGSLNKLAQVNAWGKQELIDAAIDAAIAARAAKESP